MKSNFFQFPPNLPGVCPYLLWSQKVAQTAKGQIEEKEEEKMGEEEEEQEEAA